jgi:phospholipid/cholesterol/gamma-HCH transport system permease protein
MDKIVQPSITHRRASDGTVHVELGGHWNLRTTRDQTATLLGQLAQLSSGETRWDLSGLTDLDVAGATLLWRTWQARWPPHLVAKQDDERVLRQLAGLPPESPIHAPWRDLHSPLESLTTAIQLLLRHVLGMLELLGEITLWSARLLRSPGASPLREISAAAFRSGAQALPITALLGCLIGIVLSYLSAEQLRDLGADFLIVNLLGVTILRELGPLLAAILNAGRSGSSITAQIGVMRVTHELDAMAVLGISPALRLVLPKVIGQMIALPLVVLWTDVLALCGGALGARLQLGISAGTFIRRLPQVVTLTSLWFGVAKGALFGGLVAFIACYFGLRVRPDTEGLAAGTTRSVVTALTMVLLVDALLAILFAHVGQ